MADLFDKVAVGLSKITKTNSSLVLAGAAALSVGAVAGTMSYNSNPDEEDRVQRAIAMGGAGSFYAGLGAAVVGGSVASVNKSRATYSAKMEAAGTRASKWSEKPLRLPKVFNSEAAVSKAGVLNFARKPAVMGGLGAVVGGVIGAKIAPEDQTTGVAVGTVAGGAAGVVASAAMKGTNILKKIGPGGKIAATLVGSVVLAAGAHAVSRQAEYKQDDLADSDGLGGYEATPRPSGVKNRLNTMNASGDVVLGLNNRRR